MGAYILVAFLCLCIVFCSYMAYREHRKMTKIIKEILEEEEWEK